MKRILSLLLIAFSTISLWGQDNVYLNELKQDPKKSYGNDYPYLFTESKLTASPMGYEPFYISHYARHGSRYYWNDKLYGALDTILTTAHNLGRLTKEGELFYSKFEAAKDELVTGVSELTQLGWEQHQQIARTMYSAFPEVFSKGGNVLAISSLSGRCVLSMSAFCQELVQCNPKLEIREQASRFTLDGVVPGDKENPIKHNYPKVHPKYEQHRDQFKYSEPLRGKIFERVFTSDEGIPGKPEYIAGSLLNLYTSLPNINHEGMMEGIVTDSELVDVWEESNLGAYSWVFTSQYEMIPILQDFLKKADKVISGESDKVADFRFGHDSCIGPLTVLMGINGADIDPEDPYEVKNCYQNWNTCKASNIQWVFYRGSKNPDDILVKCLLNGSEAHLPVTTDMFPYYHWSDMREFYLSRCEVPEQN